MNNTELETFKFECRAKLNGKRLTNDKFNYISEARRLAKKYEKSEHAHEIKILVECWTPYIKKTLTVASPAIIYTPDLDDYINLLVKDNELRQRLTDVDYPRLLACLCAMRVYKAIKTGISYKDYKVLELLNHWTGKSHEPSAVKSLESIINTLYGPFCWAMCNQDVDSELRLPSHLYHLGLPLQPLFTNNDKSNFGSIELDLDINLD